MCAILGFIGNSPDSRPDFGLIWEMIHANLQRGPDAWGVAAARAGKLHTKKRPGRITARRKAVRKSIADSPAFALHLRFATRGAPEDNANNHPHSFGRGALIHNGTIADASLLARLEGLTPRTACDSEVLALLVGASRERRRIDRVRRAAERALEFSDDHQQRHSLAAVWPDLIVVARAGKALHWTDREEGLYFASLGVDIGWTRLTRNWVWGIRLRRSGHEIAPGSGYISEAA